MASPGERVSVSFRGEERTTTANELGHWHVYLSPKSAGGPFDSTIRGQNTIVLHDVMVGDVWVASGQSNMEWPLSRSENGAAEVASADCPQVRLLEVKKAYAESPQENVVTSGWQACTPESVKNFSAIGYYFAREIQQKEKAPIGVIASYWGGTVAESWTSMEALSSDAALMPIFAAHARFMADQVDGARRAKLDQEKVAEAKAKGVPPPDVPWHPDPHMWTPAGLFNAMIAPLTPFPIRGVIWYQGESNSQKARAPELYGRQFQTLIQDWRGRWNVGDFPFLYVQISDFKSSGAEDWPAIREGQRKTLALRNTGMVVTIDIGNPDDVHPLDKKDVGARLALIARSMVYGEQVEYSGPLVREITRETGALRVWFDHAGSGLQAHGASLAGFEIAGSDGKFRAAEARIDGQTVLVNAAGVSDPVTVRYGWANSPTCNLFNHDGLPASPFLMSLPPLH
jgi:sialate O-acetylesterase